MSRPKEGGSALGIIVIGLVGVVFVLAKLFGRLDWPWWQVTAPFWAPFAALLAVVFITGVFALAVVYVGSRR